MRGWIHRKPKVNHDIPLAPGEEAFLTLVPETYNEAELFEWEPAPHPVSKPDEHGNLGMNDMN